ncbi:MAG: PfkB family carbohydrate kinase, partial [Victivallales bacterium]|nr:PfkB family carbohydrate kinase [Victivallales bacterium]
AGLALCGTYPPGVGAEFYRDAAATANRHGIPVLLDAWRDILPTLTAGVTWLKINREELSALTGNADPVVGMRQLLARYPIRYLAVTAGGGAAYWSDGRDFYRLSWPRLEGIVNPIGAGDTCSAVTFAEYLRHGDPPAAFAAGLAAASASCLTETAADYQPDRAVALRQTITIELITP